MDTLPDPGSRIREIRVSNDETMRVSQDQELSQVTQSSGENGQRIRGSLQLHYTPSVSEGRIQEMITVIPEDGRFPSLQIPVYCDVAGGPFRFIPGGLTLDAASTDKFRRSVLFQSDDPDAEISAVRTPEGIAVHIDNVNAFGRTIYVSGNASLLKEGSLEILFRIGGDEHVYPIRVISSK